MKRKWLKITLFSLSFLLFLIFTNPLLVENAKYHQASEFEKSTINPNKVYDIAIIMGGFSKINKTGNLLFIEDRADRLWEAVRLYKQGKVKKILITGDPATIIDDDGNSTAKIFLNYMKDFGVLEEAFILEQKARNTKENVLFSLQLFQNLPVPDSSFHIPHSLPTLSPSPHGEGRGEASSPLSLWRGVGGEASSPLNSQDSTFNIPHSTFTPTDLQSLPLRGRFRGGNSQDSTFNIPHSTFHILLITSGVHMGRALDSFHSVGLYPDYYSVSIPNPPSDITFRSFYPSWEAATDWQEILNEYVGSIIYKITD